MSEEYYATIETIANVVEEKGLAILPGFLDEAECAAMEDGFWDTFGYLTRGILSRDNEDTWRSLTDLQPTQGMLFQTYGIGQAQVLWDLRQKKKVVDVFRDIYQEDDLTVSMDGLAFSLPPEVTNRGWARGPDNTHVDQSLYDNRPHWVQGWITAKDVLDGDATFSFLPGSHLRHKEFREYKEAGGACKDCGECLECISFRSYRGGDDWYVLADKDIEFFGELERVKCPAGSMIVWDSRLFHSGSRPQRGRPNASTRMVSYITYYPKSWMTEKQQKHHRESFERGETTSHHFATRFAKVPRQYGPPKEGGAVPALPAPVLDDIGEELMNFKIKGHLEKFIEFCAEHGAYPTQKTDKELATWFAKEKKKAREGAAGGPLSALFVEEEWYREAKPTLRKP